MLMNNKGKVRNAPIPKTVSALFVLRPIVKEMPDHASPKKDMMKKINRIPMNPVSTEMPRRKAKERMITDWMTTRTASLTSLPRSIADRLTGVTNIFCRNPDSRSETIDVPDCKALLKAFCSRIPGVAKAR